MRASLKQTGNRYHKTNVVMCPENQEDADELNQLAERTEAIEVKQKTIVNPVKSPDVGMDFSLNPYQGCEHGCAYCYARPTHEYWGYEAGLDFEKKILVKTNAAEVLRNTLQTKKWIVKPISLSGNTDCYQPLERKYQITRKLLEVFLEFRHPVGIITKNALILRDLDILKALASFGLVHVAISLTTLNEELRRKMEPRTASVHKRLETIQNLSHARIPVMVMMAPIIPSLNSHEILPLAKKVAEAGAKSIGYTMLRLNGPVADVFEDWLLTHLPDRKERILNQVRSTHGGNLSDSRFGARMKGEGEVAAMVKRQFNLARKKYGLDQKLPPLNTEMFCPPKIQMQLF